ncbi:MAG: hypothetical protein WBQ75_06320 [Acetobacteraceae bacterium]
MTTRAATYCQFNQQGADAEQDGGSNQIALYHDVAVQLGSVHSVKGRTADAVLLVETEIWRGPAANQRVMDLATVVPHAFGIEDRNLSSNEAELAAATNVFVAVTRHDQCSRSLSGETRCHKQFVKQRKRKVGS